MNEKKKKAFNVGHLLGFSDEKRLIGERCEKLWLQIFSQKKKTHKQQNLWLNRPPGGRAPPSCAEATGAQLLQLDSLFFPRAVARSIKVCSSCVTDSSSFKSPLTRIPVFLSDTGIRSS